MKALILIGLQIDFFPLGAAEISNSEQILPILKEQLPNYKHVVAANYSFPPSHKMFVANYPWRRAGQVIDLMGEKILLKNYYCISGSFGAELTGGFDHQKISHTIYMGTDQKLLPHSAFFDENRKLDTGLSNYLINNHIKEIHLAGLPFEEAVVCTATDGVELGFKVKIWKDAVKGHSDEGIQKATNHIKNIKIEWM